MTLLIECFCSVELITTVDTFDFIYIYFKKIIKKSQSHFSIFQLVSIILLPAAYVHALSP